MFHGSQSITCDRQINELRNVLSDPKVNIRTRRKLLEACVRSRLTYGLQALFPNVQQLRSLGTCWNQLLRSMVKGGWKRRDTSDDVEEKDYRFVYTNADITGIIKTANLRDNVYAQYLRYTGHICRMPNTSLVKKMMFSTPERRYYRNPWLKISELLGVTVEQAKRVYKSRDEFNGLITKRLTPSLL